MSNAESGGGRAELWVGNGGVEREAIFQWEHGEQVEPWPEPVSGKELLDALTSTISRYAVLPKWGVEALALWVVHTYAFELREISTYIGLESPQKRCGKTTVLSIMCELVNRPVVASNISSPAFFRVIEEKRPTLMIDEADTLLRGNDALRGIMNAGYARKTGYVVRVASELVEGTGEVSKEATEASSDETVVKGGRTRLARFSCWCPKMIATIKHLPETLRDRCIAIGMQRKSRLEKCERVKELNGTELRRKCERFVRDNAEGITGARPEMPGELNDRAADIWEPLLALADLAGGDWPARAREAALGLTRVEQEDSAVTSLLLDTYVMLGVNAVKLKVDGAEEARIFSRDLVQALNEWEGRPWIELTRGKPITELWLAKQLRPYGLRPKTIWIGERAGKGYVMEEFDEVARRYIPKAVWTAFIEENKALEEAENKRQEAAERERAEALAKAGRNGAAGPAENPFICTRTQ